MEENEITEEDRQLSKEVTTRLQGDGHIRMVRPSYDSINGSWYWRSDLHTLENLIRAMNLRSSTTGKILEPEDVSIRLKKYGDEVFMHQRVHITRIIHGGTIKFDMSNPIEAFVFYSFTDHIS